jgi:hypothetical protein
MSTFDTVQKLIYGYATSTILSDKGSFESWYDAYLHLKHCVQNGVEPEDLDAWKYFDALDWSGLLKLIDAEAQNLQQLVNEAAELMRTPTE